ncbi:MAG: hypothetical protein KIT46_04465 [Anaerolineales bacterium]|nr:hypothetical protein [Anaerolineales bacterium]MCW5855283.1 hypothetical protein [Anaerolineales bacterium]
MSDPQIRLIFQAVNNTAGEIQKIDKDLAGMITRATQGSLAIGAVALATKKAYDLSKEGAQAEHDKQRFDRLALSIGSTGEALEAKLRPQLRGMISDAQMWASVSDLIGLGLAKDEEQAVRLAKVSSALNMNQNQLVLTLANQSRMRFDQLGVGLDGFDDKLKKLKASGLDVEAAFTEAFLQQAEEQVLKVGHAADSTLGSFLRLEAQAGTAWTNFLMQLGEWAEPVIDVAASGLENINDLTRAMQAMGATPIYGSGYVQTLYDVNGLMLTGAELLQAHQLYAELGAEAYHKLGAGITAAGGSQQAWMTDMQRWKGLAGDVGGAAEAGQEIGAALAGGIQQSLDAIDPKFGDKVAGWMGDLEWKMAGGLELQGIGEQVAAAWEAGKISDQQAREMFGSVYAEAQNLQVEMGKIDAGEAAANIANTLGVELGDASQLVTDLQAGLDLIHMKEVSATVNIVATGATWIASLVGVGVTGAASGSWTPKGNAGIKADGKSYDQRASGGPVDPRVGLYEVGEQGTEGLWWNPQLGLWEVIDNRAWEALKRMGVSPQAGFAGGGYLLDGNQYVTKPGNTSAFGTVGNIAPSAVTRPTRAASRPAAVSAGGQAVPAAMVLEQAAAAAADVSGAMAGSYQAGFQEFSAQITASNAAVEKSNLKIVAILQQMMDTQMTKYDLPAAIRDGVAQVM